MAVQEALCPVSGRSHRGFDVALQASKPGIRRAIAINLVIAWRIMLMTLLTRETPELPPGGLFSDIEPQVLRALGYAIKFQNVPNRADRVRTIALLRTKGAAE
jgi:hypothetical protein